jgi:hypothetical protein
VKSGVLLSLSIALLIPSAPAHAQYFGRNKVQWEKFDFHVLKTGEFDVYYYPEKSRAAEDAGRMAERWYARLSPVFGFEFRKRKPIVLYANQADFQQTTVTGGLIGEGIGGFTEPLKGRLVMPLTGIYAETDHVLGHEMVHEFQFDLETRLVRDHPREDLQTLPLWMVEGMAEYLSVGREDALTAMWLRDSVIHDDLPDLDRLDRDPRYFPYRYGHAFWAYVGGRWGGARVPRVFTAAMERGLERGIEKALGITAKALFEDWHASIRKSYQPVIDARLPAAAQAESIVGKEKGAGELNLAPAVSPDGSRVAFLSTRDLFTVDLFLADAYTGEVTGKLLGASGESHFDALRFIDSAASWSPDGRKIAFVVFAGGGNSIVIIDADSRRVERRLAVPGVGAISNPSWSPDGSRIAFSGSFDGVTDLCLIDVASGRLTRLTHDLYANLQPAWSPDGRTLAFVSDQGEGTDLDHLSYGPTRIRFFDIASGESRALPLFDDARHINPQFSPDGSSLYFISAPDGISNVFRCSLASGEIFRVTNVQTGVTGITALSPALSVSRSSGRVVFSVFEKKRYSLYALPPERAIGERLVAGPQADRSARVLPPLTTRSSHPVGVSLAKSLVAAPPEREPDVEKYRPSLSLDYLGMPALGISADRFGYGLASGVSAHFSDILGRHEFGVAVQGGLGSSDFGGRVGARTTYLNRSHRLNWGAVASRVPFLSASTLAGPTVVNVNGTLVNGTVIEQVRQEVTVSQAGLMSQYPLNLNRRFEAGAVYTRLDFDQQVERLVLAGNQVVVHEEEDVGSSTLSLMESSFAYVNDNAFFGFTSPVRGSRYRLEVGSALGSVKYGTVLADYRRYLFRKPLTFAFRALHYGRYGGDADSALLTPLFLGRETLVRGYSLGSLNLSECTTDGMTGNGCPALDRLFGSRLGVANFELRVPLVGNDSLGLVDAPYLPTEIAAFVDAGAAWTADESPALHFNRAATERIPVVSAGVVVRVLMGGFIPLQLYYAIPFQRPEERGVLGFIITSGW